MDQSGGVENSTYFDFFKPSLSLSLTNIATLTILCFASLSRRFFLLSKQVFALGV